MSAALGAEFALQAGLYAHLLADADLQTHLGTPPRIYDRPKRDAAFPFLTFGRSETTPSDADDTVWEHVTHVHVWSRYGGRQEAKTLVAALRKSLHDAPLTLDGLSLIHLRAVYADVFRGPDGRTTQGIVRLRAVTETSDNGA